MLLPAGQAVSCGCSFGTGEQIVKLIFLDIDGVLARKSDFNEVAQSNTLHRPCVDQLNRIIHETDAKVVLISAWRYMIHGKDITFEGMSYLLRTHGVTAQIEIVGMTCTDEECPLCHPGACITCGGVVGKVNGLPSVCDVCGKPSTRGDQIWGWLNELPQLPVPYVVIDNMDLGISAAGHPFVQCDEDFGLTAADADRAIGILNG